MLHPDLATLLGRRVGRDIQFAEDAEQCGPKDAADIQVNLLFPFPLFNHLIHLQQHKVPHKEPCKVRKVDEHADCAQPRNNLSIYPFAIRRYTSLGRSMQVHAIEACNRNGKYELEEPKHHADQAQHRWSL